LYVQSIEFFDSIAYFNLVLIYPKNPVIVSIFFDSGGKKTSLKRNCFILCVLNGKNGRKIVRKGEEEVDHGVSMMIIIVHVLSCVAGAHKIN
jgi:hypothetical protein